MPIGAKDDSSLGANVLYARDLISLSGRDPRGERKRLKPGDRLADGTIWTGNTRLDGLRRVATDLKTKIVELQNKLQEVEAQILQLAPIDDSELNPPSVSSLNKKKPTTSKTAQASEVVKPSEEASEVVKPKEVE